MSRVLSLSLADELYEGVSKHAESQGLTVYQYVRRAVKLRVDADYYIEEMLIQHDEESGD